MGEPRGEGEFAVEQGVGVRVFGEVIAEGFQRHIGFGVAELLAQQVAGAIHRAHAADPEQALDPVAAAEHFRQFAEYFARGLRYRFGSRRGQGEVGQVAGRAAGQLQFVEQLFTHP